MTTREKLLASSKRQNAVVGEPVPQFSTSIAAIADRAADGIISFYEKIHTPVGRCNIAWSAPQHKHQEWPAQLNRFFQLPPLASTYRETGNEKYAEAARDYIADWIRAHPTREDWAIASYDNTLNLSLRVGQGEHAGWTGALSYFLNSPAFDDAFLDAVFASVAAQLAYLRSHLSGAGNWRISQAECFLYTGLRLSFLPEAEAWKTLGARLLNDAYHRQILPDGVHIERNPGYHHWMTHVMERCAVLGEAMPELGLAITPDTVSRMYDYAVAATYPNGSLCGLHDCRGSRAGIQQNVPARRRAAFRKKAGLPDVMPPTSRFFPNAGQAFLRDGWGEDAVYITFDATVWGGGHCHLSRNAVQLFAYGRALLVDPGALNYEMSDPAGPHGKSTRAHNTLNLNGWNQSSCDPDFTRHAAAEGYDIVVSRYSGGYWPGEYQWYFVKGHGAGIWAQHHRALLWIRDRCIVVIDNMCRTVEMNAPSTHEAPSLEANWQLSEGPVTVAADERRVVTGDEHANLLMLFPLFPSDMKLSAHEGETNPMRGWLSGGSATQNAHTPAPQITLESAPMRGWSADLVAVLIPFRGKNPPRVDAEAQYLAERSIGSLALRWDDGTTDAIYWTRGLYQMIGAHADIVTDAGLVHLRKDANGALKKGMAFDGTYCAPHDTRKRDRPDIFVF